MDSSETLNRQRVTQTDVARVAGVHNTTVSLSLRNCPSIPEGTRKRIRAIADQMGYYPDPTLQALVAYRKGRLTNRSRETLAYLTNWDTRWGWREMPALEQAYAGALRKAAELGYQLEHFWLGEPGMNQRRMSHMLYHRGITGVLVAAHRESGPGLTEIDWSRLSAVKIGDLPLTPVLNRVVDDHGGAVRLAMRKAAAAGFGRIGLVTQEWNSLAYQAWTAGFLIEQGNIPLAKRLPVLRLDAGQSGASQLSALGSWYRAYSPDVVIGSSQAVLGRMRQLRLRVPQHVAYIDLCLESADSSVAGVRQNGGFAGEVAAALLVGQLQQNLCGTPSVGTSTMVDGSWCDGATLPVAAAPLEAGAPLSEGALLATA